MRWLWNRRFTVAAFGLAALMFTPLLMAYPKFLFPLALAGGTWAWVAASERRRR